MTAKPNKNHKLKAILVISFSLLLTATLGAAGNSGFFTDKPVFRMALPEITVEWHPHRYYNSYEAQLFTAVYEGLVSYHPITQRPIPAVAESWTLNPEGTIYTFTIRKTARYWNGDEVKASHFVDTWKALLALGSEAPFSTLLEPIAGVKAYRSNPKIGTDNIGIKAINDTTLEIRLEQPSSYFLHILCHQSMVPVHPSLLANRRWTDTTEIIGNGPFFFLSRSNKQTVLARNPLYWDNEETKIEKIEIDYTDDANTVTAQFNSHYYQWVSTDVNYNAIGKKSSIVITPQFSTNFLFFNNRIPAWQDSRVRKALGLMLDLGKLRDPDVYFIPASRLVPEIPYYPPIASFPSTNKEQALTLLAEAGYPQGSGLPPIVIKVPAGENYKRISDLLIEAWKGLKTSIQYLPYEGNDYNDHLNGSDYTLGSLGWIGDYADPLTFLDLFSAGSNLNAGKYSDKTFEELLAEAQTKQGANRYKSLARAEEHLVLNMACIPLSHNPSINIIDLDQVDGWYENPFDLHPFKSLAPKAAVPPRNIAKDTKTTPGIAVASSWQP